MKNIERMIKKVRMNKNPQMNINGKAYTQKLLQTTSIQPWTPQLLFFILKSAQYPVHEEDVLHLAIRSVVLGELTEPGCFVDWDSLSKLIDEHRMKQFA